MTRVKTHPGRVLRMELEARGMSANRLALAIRVPANRITAILRGERAVTARARAHICRQSLETGVTRPVVRSGCV